MPAIHKIVRLAANEEASIEMGRNGPLVTLEDIELSCLSSSDFRLALLPELGMRGEILGSPHYRSP